jgi:glycosyltransferase involved in cell wall biosynthesis
MNILFIHHNFPAQFKFLAPALAADSENNVIAMTTQKITVKEWQGIKIVPYSINKGSTPHVHPWVTDFETKVIRGEACYRAALHMREQGFTPDIIVAHPGWGESLFLKDIWPNAKLGIYCEFFYHAQGADVGFDPEFSCNDQDSEVCRLRLKNINNLLHFQVADAGISPTYWQASTFPEPFRHQITVVHDGIDTETIAPKPTASINLSSIGVDFTLTKADEIITFVSRDLEPYRGYHIFMRALPTLLKRRPKARVLIVGSDGVSYGHRPKEGQKWKEIFAAEVRPQISDSDWGRVHFVGKLPYPLFISLLQISTVHVYLTYPFVLSWSLLEAMSVGCAIVASDTQPLREAIHHDETGRLVNFFDSRALTNEICALLEDPLSRARLGANARAFSISNYNLKTVCLPKQLEWVLSLNKQ